MTKRAEETRIAIFTITGGLNYGQRLQNYALQETLKGFADEAHDVEVETVINTIWGESSMMSYYDRIEGGKVPACFAQWKREGFPVEEFSSWLGREISRQQVFEQFDRAYINRSPIMVSRENLERVGQELGDAYDWGVVGSDQVWNPGSVISGYEFAACMPPERRVSYAASFGKQTIPEKMRPWYRTYLSGLAHISVREEAGATIVRETAGREAVVVPDPVMLLPKEIWRLVMKRPEHIDTQAPYLLVYDLRMNDPKFAEHVRALAAQRDLALIVLPGYEVPFYNIVRLNLSISSRMRPLSSRIRFMVHAFPCNSAGRSSRLSKIARWRRRCRRALTPCSRPMAWRRGASRGLKKPRWSGSFRTICRTSRAASANDVAWGRRFWNKRCRPWAAENSG